MLAQSRVEPSNLQKDGWGIAHFEGGRTRVVKSPNAAFDETRRFRRAADGARGRVIIGHLRAASNPRGLPAKAVLGKGNNQPFTDGRILFAHNGTLQIPDEVAAYLGPFRRKLRSKNDSEVYFWQLMKHLRLRGNIPDALESCVKENWTIWKRCRRRYPDKPSPFTGLNVIVSDGRTLHAMCLYTNKMKGSHCFYTKDKPWGQMSMARRGDRYIVASEDMDEGKWRRLGQGEIVSLTPADGRVAVRRRKVRLA
ncbi:MAG: class II glutamine amidotransferase [Elusimicrobia bacterium]|nr:class II glutamine amidotransferase [Elusimicrobiota bacterium]